MVLVNENWRRDDRLMSNLGAAIEIPCYFRLKSDASNFSQNNMGSPWQLLNWTLIDHHNITFLIGGDPYEDNLKRKSIFFAVLLKFNFVVPGRSTINSYDFNRFAIPSHVFFSPTPHPGYFFFVCYLFFTSPLLNTFYFCCGLIPISCLVAIPLHPEPSTLYIVEK